MRTRIRKAAELSQAPSRATRKQISYGRNGASEEQSSRVAKLPPPRKSIDFAEWRTVIRENFPALVKPAEACASVIAQLLLNDATNPFALALVDVPSSGKTITLNFFDVPELIYSTDDFTPASFVSHASNVRRDELAQVDLLPRIRFKTMVVRDLAPIFGAKEDELLKSLALLTRALDGEGLEIDSGVHGQRGYHGDWLFMLLAGTTPIPPRVFKIMGSLGSRLFCLALHSPVKDDYELMAQNRGSTCGEKVERCKQATRELLHSLWTANSNGVNWNKQADADDCLRVIARCAGLLATLRGVIQTWMSEHNEAVTHSVPVIENPDRINCLLYNLARAHALIRGRQQLASIDLSPVLEVTFDSAPTIRAKLFRGLVRAGGSLQTHEVEKLLRCSKPTALKEMEALAVLDVVEKIAAEPDEGRPENRITLHDKFSWFTSSDCHRLMAQS
jgi:hypothetical protein